jgi:hypothetical protein
MGEGCRHIARTTIASNVRIYPPRSIPPWQVPIRRPSRVKNARVETRCREEARTLQNEHDTSGHIVLCCVASWPCPFSPFPKDEPLAWIENTGTDSFDTELSQLKLLKVCPPFPVSPFSKPFIFHPSWPLNEN